MGVLRIASGRSFFLGFTDSLVQLGERSRLLAVGYGKVRGSGQWGVVLGSGVRGQDPSRGGVLGSGVRGQDPSMGGGGAWQWGA